MNRSLATTDALTVATKNRRSALPASIRRHVPGRSEGAAPAPSRLPREYRIAHVFRTLGRGLVAEYDPA